MENKFKMSVSENIFLAKRNIVDIIWKSAKLEGLNVTFPDTEAIFNGLVVSDIKVDTVIAINNLKHAWQFVLDSVDYPIDYPYICKINQYVGSNLIDNAGFIRNFPVSIGGTIWKPEMPIESKIKEEISEITQISNPTDRAVTLMLALMRRQMFSDGNKRTSMLAGNQVMISNGAGVISVPIELQREFSKLLVEFYETNQMDKIKDFVFNFCIEGIPAINNQQQQTYNPTNDYYLKVSFDEAMTIQKSGIHFEGTIQKDRQNVIRIDISDKEATEAILLKSRKIQL